MKVRRETKEMQIVDALSTVEDEDLDNRLITVENSTFQEKVKNNGYYESEGESLSLDGEDLLCVKEE